MASKYKSWYLYRVRLTSKFKLYLLKWGRNSGKTCGGLERFRLYEWYRRNLWKLDALLPRENIPKACCWRAKGLGGGRSMLQM